MRRLEKAMFVLVPSLLVSSLLSAAPPTDKVATSYRLEIDKRAPAVFSACRHIGSENEITLFRSGGDSDLVRKLAGNLLVFNPVCSRTITRDRSLWDWRKVVEDGGLAGARTNATLVLLGPGGTEIARWNLFQAWPAKLEAGTDENEVAIETITIAVERIERVN